MIFNQSINIQPISPEKMWPLKINERKNMTEPWHDKTNKVNVRPAKTQISLGIRPVWSESSLSAWRKLGSLATHWAHSEDWSDWVDAQADLSLHWPHSHLLVLSCCGSCLKPFLQTFVPWSVLVFSSHPPDVELSSTGRTVHVSLDSDALDAFLDH